MNEQTQSSRVHGILLALIALVALATLLVVMVRSQADDIGQSATVSNADPVVDTINIAIVTGGADQAAIAPTEGTVRDVFVWGTAHDDNGCGDIDVVATSLADGSIDFFRSAVGFGAVDDSNDHYSSTAARTTITGCAGGADLTVDWETQFDDIQYYIDPTDADTYVAQTWTARIVITDESAATSAAVTDDTEISSLAALDIDAAIAYGSLALAATSAQDEVVVTNTGNRALTSSTIVADGDMVCSVLGTIPVGNAEVSDVTGFAYGAGQDLSLVASIVDPDADLAGNLVLPRRTAGVVTDSLYFRVLMPSDGVRGLCSNTLTLTAVASAD